MSNEDKSGIAVTKKAADEILDIIKKEQFDPATIYLRVGVRGGGCSGFNYTLDISQTKRDSDEVFEQYGLKVICDPKSLLYLAGTKIDFRDEIMGRGFVFENPNASNVCGCKSSFSV